MSAKQKLYLKIVIIIPLIGLFLTAFYRPYIYSHNINDFGFADVIGSLVSVIGFCTLIWYYKDYPNKTKNLHIIIATFIYSIVWEAFGYFNIYGTFDKKDVIASIISGFITFLIKKLVETKFSVKTKYRAGKEESHS